MGISTNHLAALLAPIVGVACWKLMQYLARKAHDFLWVRLPDGKLRNILLRKVD